MLKDLLVKNRSYRSYDSSVKVSRETLLQWVDNARYTPSSVNMQALKFKLCYTEDDKNLVFPLTGWAKGLPDRKLPPEGHEPSAYIVICQDMSISDGAQFIRDTGIVAQTIMLSAVEAGFGGCMIGAFSAEKVQSALGLASHLFPRLILAIGKPDEEIVLEEAKDGQVKYYRDEKDVHHVPKRPLGEIIL